MKRCIPCNKSFEGDKCPICQRSYSDSSFTPASIAAAYPSYTDSASSYDSGSSSCDSGSSDSGGSCDSGGSF